MQALLFATATVWALHAALLIPRLDPMFAE
jgi:hypothetical protein